MSVPEQPVTSAAAFSMARVRPVSFGLLTCLVGTALFAFYWTGASGHTDFDQVYLGALAIRARANPYAVVGPGRHFEWHTPLYYPLPALLAALPLTVFPIHVAAGIFVAVSCFLFGWAIGRDGNRWRLLTVASQSFLMCVGSAQWSVLMLAACYLPAVGAIALVKPNVALIASSHWRRARDLIPLVVGSAVLLTISFAVRPSWPRDWATTLGSAPLQHAPVATVAGISALGVLLRWRRPEARVLAAYALIPQTPGPYTDLLLFAIPKSRWEFVCLAFLSYCTLPVARLLGLHGSLGDQLIRYQSVSSALMLLPCVIMVLLRPNTGDVPAWLHRRLDAVPAWIRGFPATQHADHQSEPRQD